MSYAITSAVQDATQKLFGGAEISHILFALETTPLPLIPRTMPLAERVHLAILHQSRGDLETFRSALTQAMVDWRDVLMAAGLAHENWPEVLQARGIGPLLGGTK